jgi:soluble lytic murein transglycosylase-like protein
VAGSARLLFGLGLLMGVLVSSRAGPVGLPVETAPPVDAAGSVAELVKAFIEPVAGPVRADPPPYPPAVERWRGLAERIGAEEGLDVDLLLCVIAVESDGIPNRTSRAGAHGLMQVMPGTFREVHPDGNQTINEDNIRAGARYLRRSLEAHRDLLWALAGYNAGIDATVRLRRELGYVPDWWLGGEPFAYMHNVQACLAQHQPRSEPAADPGLPARHHTLVAE